MSVRDSYKDIISEIAVDRFKPHMLCEEEVNTIVDLITRIIMSPAQTDYTTGLVVAGFGSGDEFPAVKTVEVDGRVMGFLKVSTAPRQSVDDLRDMGRVVSFAQTDVIERLLGGADPHFVQKTSEYIEKIVGDVASALLPSQGSKRVSVAKKKERENLIEDIAQAAAERYLTETANELKDRFSREFDRMIAMMPKQELIEFAEALVSITAVERKATSDEGTVGGPIDVAMITRHEGFVWIRRKHYFDKELNPRYFWRKFRSQPGGM